MVEVDPAVAVADSPPHPDGATHDTARRLGDHFHTIDDHAISKYDKRTVAVARRIDR